jgi:hypothetical protein
MREAFTQYLARAKARHGERFSDAELWPQFRSWYETGQRIRVRTIHADGSTFERTGVVGITTGWRPAFLLIHRSNARGSWDTLGAQDEVVAVKRGKTYQPLAKGEDAYGRLLTRTVT